MKTLFFFIYFTVAIMCACNMNNYENAVTALDGGREFIDGCLKGDFKQASFYMINDSANNSELLKIKRDYNLKSADEKHKYASASIIINDRVARKVKVINQNGKWLVDFKYTFNGNL